MNAYQNFGYRLSDAERAAVMAELDAHYACGRLTLEEHQRRIDFIQKANFQGEITPLLQDLPPIDDFASTPDLVRLPQTSYTSAEIAAVRKKGRHTRLGIFALSGVTGAALSIGLGMPWFWLLPVTVFILLYIMKVGPDSWHAPSPRQLAAQRMRSVKMLQAAELAQRKQERKLQQEQLKHTAINVAQQNLQRFQR